MTYRGVNVLVTGADGFIGSHLTEELIKQEANVTALSLYNSYDSFGWIDDIADPLRKKIRVIRGDIRDAAMIRRIVQEQKVIFHLAALIAIPHSYAAPQSYIETNIIGTLNLLEATRESGVERIVLTSTSEVYGSAITMPISETHPLQGQSPYSASKIGADMMGEAFARSFGSPVVILRPFNTYGPRQSERAIIPTVIRQAIDPECPTISVGDTTTVRDLTFVQDTVSAFIAAGSSENIEFGRPYNAGSGKAISVSDLIQRIAEITESRKPIVHDERRMRPTQSEVRALLSNSSLFSSATGWHPQISLAEGLARTIEWWRKQIATGHVRREKGYVT